ncbi:MAG TPA: hypothetical protein DIT62_03400, partial [Alphaproteobacteria bacterium]|nr:hypothetical protein [Alphaproteobacteria bacterium]
SDVSDVSDASEPEDAVDSDVEDPEAAVPATSPVALGAVSQAASRKIAASNDDKRRNIKYLLM